MHTTSYNCYPCEVVLLESVATFLFQSSSHCMLSDANFLQGLDGQAAAAVPHLCCEARGSPNPVTRTNERGVTLKPVVRKLLKQNPEKMTTKNEDERG